MKFVFVIHQRKSAFNILSYQASICSQLQTTLKLSLSFFIVRLNFWPLVIQIHRWSNILALSYYISHRLKCRTII